MFSEYLIFFASIAAVSALAIGPTPDVGTTVTLCTDPNGVSGCLNIPVNSDTCRSLTGGFRFLNDGSPLRRFPQDSSAPSSTLRGESATRTPMSSSCRVDHGT
ncbi:hypothetical protein C8J57DRAFT_1723585 [Mycena rebaudengoi]|nr:hypothetical protein C8J57DRAFT_1723585 [Mycena rebaudengoi]